MKTSTTTRQPGLKKIAELSGVSMMTVSRALRGQDTVAADTAKKIREVAETLRYRPNRLVHGLRTGRTHLVSAVLPFPFGFYESALRSIEQSLDARGCSLILNLVEGHYGRDAMREEIRRLRRCIELRVDGIILRPVNDDANAVYFSEAIERQVPMVVIDRRLPDFTSDYVGTENFAGGESAARILLSRGCRNLAILHAGGRVCSSRDRRDGFLKAVADSGKTALSIDCGDFRVTPESLAERLREPSARDIDGVFAISDSLAFTALQVLQDSGRTCPDRVKILGFGKSEKPASGAHCIASFDQHGDLIGSEAVDLLMQRLSNPTRTFRSVLIPASFTDGDTL